MSDTKTYCAKAQGTSKHAWLFDYTKNCTNYGCNIVDLSTSGYWTSTPVFGKESSDAWYISKAGNIAAHYVVRNVNNGVRPVVTVQKSVIE